MRSPFRLKQVPGFRSRNRFRPVVSDAGAGASHLEVRALLSSFGPAEIRARTADADHRGERVSARPARVEPPHPNRTTVARRVQVTGVTSQPDALIYIPPGLQPGRTYPLLVVFNAAGNPSAAIRYWKSQARRHHWIIYASREFSNAAALPSDNTVEFWPGDPTNYIRDLASHYRDPNLLATIKSHIDAAVARLAVDRSRIILAGFSGGAFIAHDLNASYPGFAAAVIDNSNGEPVLGPAGSFEEPFVPTAGAFATSRREAIFLVGESDTSFRSQIEETIPIYQQRWGWQTLFLTYPGEHKPAPARVLNQAIAWLLSRPTWA